MRAGSPFHAFWAAACSARPYENESCQGCVSAVAFIAFRCAVASSSLWPPERNTTPGTAAGTVRRRLRTVASATSWTPACRGQLLPETTMFGLRSIPSRDTRWSWSAAKTAVSYTHLRAHETPEHLVCRLLLE